MIAKKNSRFDLERKRTALFQMGLLTVGSLTLAAFTYKSPVKTEFQEKYAEHKVVNITLEDFEPEKPKIKQISHQKNEQDNDQQITQTNLPPSDDIVKTNNTSTTVDANLSGELGIPKGDGELGKMVEISLDDEIDEFPPTPTEYIGGYVAMQKFIDKKISYPEESIMFEEEGIVYVSFVIEKDGSVSTVKIERGVTRSLDREAKRLVRLFPKWKPAENAYGAVRTRVRMPLVFKLK
ncbi:MAG TPA: energy transducer TonB [Crocinitomicaceae bacterium]|nr:energy transducer TonB [Crocinitomicaceae bacterium]